MGAMRTQNPWMIPKVHMLIHNVPEYVRRIAAPLGPTSEQALSIFLIFLPPIQSELYERPVFRERLLNAVLLYNACHLEKN